MLKKTGYSYWIITGLLLLAASLSFSGHRVRSVSILKIKEDLGIPDIDYGFIHSYRLVIVLMTLAFVAHGLWITSDITSIVDVVRQRVTSTVVGVSGSAGAVSVLALNPIIGYVVTDYSYGPFGWYAGVICPLAFLLLSKFIPRTRNDE